MDKILDEIIEELYQAKLGSLETKPIRTGDYRVGLTKAIDIIEKHKNNVDLAVVVGRSEQLSPDAKPKIVGDFDNDHNDSFRNID